MEAWIADPVVTSSALFSDAVDVMRQNEFREAVLKAISEYFDSVPPPAHSVCRALFGVFWEQSNFGCRGQSGGD